MTSKIEKRINLSYPIYPRKEAPEGPEIKQNDLILNSTPENSIPG